MSTKRGFGYALLLHLFVFSAIMFPGQVSAVQTQTESQISAPRVGAGVAATHSQESLALPVRQQDAIRIATSDFSNEITPQRRSLADQFFRWYATLGLGRHGPAVAFELLLVACFIALRINAKREDRAATKRSNHALDAHHPSSE